MGDPSALANALTIFMGGALIQPIYKGEIYKFLQTVSGLAVAELSEIMTLELRRFKADRAIQAFIKIEQQLSEAGIALWIGTDEEFSSKGSITAGVEMIVRDALADEGIGKRVVDEEPKKKTEKPEYSIPAK